MILMKYHFSKIKKGVTKFVVCCSHDLRFKDELAKIKSDHNISYASAIKQDSAEPVVK